MVLAEIKVPYLDVNIKLAYLDRIYFKDFDKVEKGKILFSISSAKFAEDISSDFDGYVVFLFKEGQEVKSGDTIAKIYDNLDEAMKDKEIYKVMEEKEPIRATKKAIKLAEEYHIDLGKIVKNGIITESDIKEFIDSNKKK